MSVSEEATAFVSGMRPLYDAVIALVVAGDRAWVEAGSMQERASVILFEGRRISHLCLALSITPRTTESKSLFSHIAGVLSARRDTLSNATELLRTPGATFGDLYSERQASTLSLLEFGSRLDEFAETANTPATAGTQGYFIANPLLELTVSVAPGWVTVRNGIDIVITAPSNVQRYTASGIGPDAWKLGTTLRVRRFQNEAGRTLDEAVEMLGSLLDRFGSRTDKDDSPIGDETGVRLVYTNADGHWLTMAGATVVSDVTYLFELGCPAEFSDECETAFSDLMAGVTFNEG